MVDPKVMFKVTAYAYECGIYSTRQMEEACRYRVDFMWLLEDQPVPDHSTFARFRTGRCSEAVEDLFYQYVKYITGIEVFSNRTDFGTLAPFLEEVSSRHGCRYRKVVADAGYESLENYLYLEKKGQMSFIKPANYEQAKTKKYRSQIGRAENMRYDAGNDSYICAEGRALTRIHESTDRNGVVSTCYRGENCSGCSRRAQCCAAKDPEAPKEIKVKKALFERRKKSLENISTEEGICLRMCRSIQVEGAFALLKNDFGFRRFLTAGKKNVKTELLFLALAFDLKKNWMKAEAHREESHLSRIKKTA